MRRTQFKMLLKMLNRKVVRLTRVAIQRPDKIENSRKFGVSVYA